MERRQPTRTMGIFGIILFYVSDFDYFCRIEKILLKCVAFVIYMDYYDNTNLLTPCFNSLEISKLKDAICILFLYAKLLIN